MYEKELQEIFKELRDLRELVDILIDDYLKRNPPEDDE